MNFQFDTGDATLGMMPRMDHLQTMSDGILDSLPADATQAQIDAATVAAILGALRTPKTMQTVRRHFLRYWPLIAPLAHSDPAGFDEIITAFAERSTELPG